MRVARRRSAWALALTMLAGCPEPASPQPESGAHADAEHQDAHASSSSAWVQVQAPQDATLLEAPATVVAQADGRARIDVPYRSTVVEARVQVGDRVEAGAAVVEVAVPELLSAAAVLSGADDQIGTHRRRKDRLEDLQGQGLVGAADVFELERSLGALSADRRLALATFKAAGVDPRQRGEVLRRGTVMLRSPVAGVVSHLDATPGAVIEPGGRLATVLGRAPARVEVALSQPLPPGLRLEFVGADGSRFALRPEPVATAIEPGLGRTLAWYEPADGEPRSDGLRGRVVVHAEADDLLQVPRGALRLYEGRAYVARRPPSTDAEAGHDAEPERVEVQVLRSSGASALVRSATLKLGDSIAVDSQTVLLIGRDADELGGGHVH
ncbi:MAG: efflux RND transporter periplasmic adaptor subunit [Nannocystaceae bacterium]